VVKTQGQQLLAKEEEIRCVVARSLEEVQNDDTLVYLRAAEAHPQERTLPFLVLLPMQLRADP